VRPSRHAFRCMYQLQDAHAKLCCPSQLLRRPRECGGTCCGALNQDSNKRAKTSLISTQRGRFAPSVGMKLTRVVSSSFDPHSVMILQLSWVGLTERVSMRSLVRDTANMDAHTHKHTHTNTHTNTSTRTHTSYQGAMASPRNTYQVRRWQQ